VNIHIEEEEEEEEGKNRKIRNVCVICPRPRSCLFQTLGSQFWIPRMGVSLM